MNVFNDDGEKKYRLLSLDNPMYYAFVINNEHKLKEEFREINAEISAQYRILLGNKNEWHIPKEDVIRYDASQVTNKPYIKNVYEGYTSRMVSSKCGKSISEMLFEKFCENSTQVKYVYKNGDKGDEYFSVIYYDGLNHQMLFYPDYIIIMADGSYMIIETKGGENKGKSKNIDKQVFNKFKAFKTYAYENDIKWGFVRDKDTELYINNTEYTDDMNNENWVPLNEVIK